MSSGLLGNDECLLDYPTTLHFEKRWMSQTYSVFLSVSALVPMMLGEQTPPAVSAGLQIFLTWDSRHDPQQKLTVDEAMFVVLSMQGIEGCKTL